MAKRILIVDDDPDIRNLYNDVLKGEGYEVETAIDGEEGLNKIMAGGFNLILLDIMMPKLDGIGVLTNLSESTKKPNNGPIILLTNLSNDPAIADALKKGARDCFIKADLNPSDFVSKIKSFIS